MALFKLTEEDTVLTSALLGSVAQQCKKNDESCCFKLHKWNFNRVLQLKDNITFQNLHQEEVSAP
jgi:hypothetical protein